MSTNTGYEYVCHQIWAIKEENLKLIMDIASRVNPSLEAVEAKLGRELSNANNSKQEGVVQVIDIRGPIVRHGDLFSDVSGAKSLSSIKREFTAALENEDVKAIMLNIDSPGGEAAGIAEFSELIYNSRGKKPIVSYVEDMAASAAYWIGSATDKIVAGETATLGSIGCLAVMKNTEEKDEKEGIKNIKFISNNSPNKRPDILTEEGKSLMQAQVDTIADIFIEKVARNRSIGDRKLTFSDVVNKFNKGGVLIGKDAVQAGLADELGSFESVLKSLSSEIATQNDKEITSMSEKTKVDDTTKVAVKEEETTMADGGVRGIAASLAAPVSVEAFEALQAQHEELSTKYSDLSAKFTTLFSSYEDSQAVTAKLEQENLVTKAEAEFIKLGSKVVPADKESFMKKYSIATTDDKNNPIEDYSRVEALLESYSNMPDHSMTTEMVVVKSTKADDKEEDISKMRALAEEFAKNGSKAVAIN